MALHHPTSLTCASRSPPCQHDNRSALLLVVTSWCQERESSSAIGHSRSPAQKCGTACQSTSSHLTLSLPSRTDSRHICLNCHTASRSDDLFDVDRRHCSDSRHVMAPYKSALYYYYFIHVTNIQPLNWRTWCAHLYNKCKGMLSFMQQCHRTQQCHLGN